jgi:hypothetical protein
MGFQRNPYVEVCWVVRRVQRPVRRCTESSHDIFFPFQERGEDSASRGKEDAPICFICF